VWSLGDIFHGGGASIAREFLVIATPSPRTVDCTPTRTIHGMDPLSLFAYVSAMSRTV
jgi:hypothetical protein